MDANVQTSIPAPEASDSSDVQAALQAASNLWEQDPREALRWLRKAAEGAADAGDDLRSVKLARAAADLRSAANIQASFPPPGSAVPSAPAPNGSAASAPTASAPAASAPTASAPNAAEVPPAPAFNNQNPAQTVPATPAAAAAAALQQASHAAQQAGPAGLANVNQTPAVQQEAPVQQAAAEAAVAAQQAAQAAAAAAQQAAAERAAAERAAVEQAAQAAAEQAAAQQAAAQQAAAEQAAAEQAAQQAEDRAPISTPSGPSFVSHRTVRVALSPAPTGEGIFSVHPLAEGETAQPGWKEVLLVALDPGERMFPGRD